MLLAVLHCVLLSLFRRLESVITGFKLLILIFLSVRARDPGVMWVRSFRKCDWDQVRTDLANAPWSVMSVYDDLDDKWDFFHNILQNSLQLFTPLKRV